MVKSPRFIELEDNRVLAPDQMRITNEIVDRVRAGMEERASREDAWQDGHGGDRVSGIEEHARRRAALAVLGPAGSGQKHSGAGSHRGKPTTMKPRYLLWRPQDDWQQPTATSTRTWMWTTIHGAFALWKPEQETLELMMPYDLIVVEELGQLSESIFERPDSLVAIS